MTTADNAKVVTELAWLHGTEAVLVVAGPFRTWTIAYSKRLLPTHARQGAECLIEIFVKLQRHGPSSIRTAY